VLTVITLKREGYKHNARSVCSEAGMLLKMLQRTLL